MKKNKAFILFFSLTLILSIAWGIFVCPDFVYGDVFLKKSVQPTSIIKKGAVVEPRDKSSGEQQQMGISENTDLATAQQDKKNYVEGELIVTYKKGAIDLMSASGKDKSDKFVASKTLQKKEDLKSSNASVLEVKSGASIEQKMIELRNDSSVESVQFNYIYEPMAISTNDTYRSNMWGLDNTGQTISAGFTGIADADMDVPEAWSVNEGTNESIIVAVIDTGVAYQHPDLAANMWDGANCKDDTDVFLGGCNYGYDYEDGDKSPLPTTSSHGTHVAGIIAGVKNNGKGILGIAPNAKIMALKSGLTTSDNVKSINFAKYNGATVINASWGGTGNDLVLKAAIQGFPGLFIAAAGNGKNYGDISVGDNHDGEINVYPSDYDLDNIISVAATGQSDNLALFSDYGVTSVDVGAPGEYIYSTIAESAILSETFDSLVPPNAPVGWVKSGGTDSNWTTYALDAGTYWGNVLYVDSNLPYLDSAPIATSVTSPAYNLNGSVGAKMEFWTQCDTEYVALTDYMALDFSSDGVNFDEIMKWNEVTLDSDADSSGAAVYYYDGIVIDPKYDTSNFKFRFRWVTNGNGDYGGGDGDGCFVDDVKIITDMTGSSEQYGYMSGTSMATPYVAGLVALIEGYNPSLTDSQVKNIVMTTGDSLAVLSGKTVTGKRVNAKSALDAAAPPPTVSISGVVKYYDGIKVIPDATVILEDGSSNQLATTTTDSNGLYSFTGLDSGGNYLVKVEKTGSNSGLTSLDQLVIQRHILGIALFTDIYKIIAADINRSKTLTSLDRLAIKRFILGIDTWTTTVWRFYSSGSVLDSNNYLTEGLSRSYSNLATSVINQDFVGIKMGDVNNSWVNN